ncbi:MULTISPECIES: ATP-grasp domain-containing protein [Aerococcus]|uniref:ATP-grasp domain-containing protein n=1 Tax=Aerococcus loyolae TaxID=2976809 RepID=A0ABT4C2E8_9LACT|nr:MULTISPECIES: ATP-grasp domain-containing protein [Aerococcus]KAA9219083.1 ATP-grasp domain-containing protein [Aerococcus loyolae]KAA9265096.1 ATP-grasp domain-containing protein [Aerococcus loyolae]MCY3026135.1 ATP-grasp domain-containing protein [Aerococcus loyolae]MCY3027607.1 ATP-grasp domain-containing protein [Aerococcus loyolae]MCY3029478.1 ATP-grasp domain-containing protein [Aerococcus loyolae]
MNFIYISPYFPQNFQEFAVKLHQNGATVLGIGSEAYDILPASLKEALTEYYRVDNLEDTLAVKKAVAFFFHKYGPIDRIESQEEYWLELDAQLREQFNIVGMKPKELKKIKHKSEMKKYFKKAKCPVAKGRLVRTKVSLKRAAKALGYPVVLKPDVGVGAGNTYRIDNDNDLEKFEAQWDHTTPYFMEEFIEGGQLCTFDGLLDQEGNIVWYGSLTYEEPTLDWVNGDRDGVYWIEKEVDPKLKGIGENVVKAFGIKERFFHIEFFRMPDNSYLGIEYNNRAVGGFGHDAYDYAHSIDLYDMYAKVVLGKEIPANPNNSRYCVVTFRQAGKNYQHSVADIKERYANDVKAVKDLPKVYHDLLGSQLFAILCDNENERQAITDYIRA